MSRLRRTHRRDGHQGFEPLEQLEPRQLLSAEFALPIDDGGFANTAGAIDVRSDIDTWGFTALGTGWGSVSVSGRGGLPTRLQIFDEDGDSVTTEKRSEDGRGIAATLMYLVEGEDYVARVRGNGSIAGEYGITASVPISVSDRVRTSIAIDPTNGDGAVSSTLGDAEDFRGAPSTRYYEFTPADSGLVEIELIPLTNSLDPLLVLHESSGNWINISGNGGDGHSVSIERELSGGRSYILAASSWDGGGSFSLRIDGPHMPDDPNSDDPDEPLDDELSRGEMRRAKGIWLGKRRGDGARRGRIASIRDDDVFRFSPLAMGDVRVRVDGRLNLDAEIAIFDAFGNQRTEWTDQSGRNGREVVVFPGESGSVYFVKVSGDRGSTGRYKVSVDGRTDRSADVQRVIGATQARNARGISIGEFGSHHLSRQGRIREGADNTLFWFVPDRSGQIQIRVDPRRDLDAWFTVRDAGGNRISTIVDRSGDGGVELLTLWVGRGNLFFLDIRGHGSGQFDTRIIM